MKMPHVKACYMYLIIKRAPLAGCVGAAVLKRMAFVTCIISR